MTPDRGLQEVTVTLTRFEWNHLMRGGRQLRIKAERQLIKDPDFVPESGRTNVNREYILQYNSALDKIEKQWGSSLDHLRK